ncbi:MAG TPA: trehalose-phosphatase [Solirubrobacterales bacterium]|nr:trehalose-phosphatase [Solirubrobacterales bacterium]
MSSPDSPLSILFEDPASSALMSDIDGTLCRIVDRPEKAKVPVRAKEALERLSDRLALVACVTGRPAATAKKMVGAENIVYFGSHGLELFSPGYDEPRQTLLGEEAERAKRFVAENDNPHWVSAKIRLEDKGPIQALHWRGAGERTEAFVHEIAADAEAAGLVTHWGRKVLELRPPDMDGKAGAVEELITGSKIETVVFAGDDRTDLDAVLRLKALQRDGKIKNLLIAGVESDEGPDELIELADIVVQEPDEWIDLIEDLAKQTG